MKKFNLSGTVTVSVFTVVEANSLEEAIEIAQERHIEAAEYNSKDQAETVWVNEEYDGEVQKIQNHE